MVAFTPKERTQVRTNKSGAALVAEYGLEGLEGVDSVKRSGSSSAKSSVHFIRGHMVKTNIVAANSLEKCVSTGQIVLRNGRGSCSELSLWDSAENESRYQHWQRVSPRGLC